MKGRASSTVIFARLLQSPNVLVSWDSSAFIEQDTHSALDFTSTWHSAQMQASLMRSTEIRNVMKGLSKGRV